jgi:hypothetical protein
MLLMVSLTVGVIVATSLSPPTALASHSAATSTALAPTSIYKLPFKTGHGPVVTSQTTSALEPRAVEASISSNLSDALIPHLTFDATPE